MNFKERAKRFAAKVGLTGRPTMAMYFTQLDLLRQAIVKSNDDKMFWARAARDGALIESERLRERVEALTAVIKQQEVDLATERRKVAAAVDLIESLAAKINRLEKAAKPKQPAKARVMKATKGKKAPVA